MDAEPTFTNFEGINYFINVVNTYLMRGQKRVLVVARSPAMNWIVADSFLEIAALVVVKYMLENDYTMLARLTIIKQNEGRNFTLVNSDYY